MKLILVRHGRSVGNEKRIHEGQRHGALSEIGFEQAKKVAEELKKEHIDEIYSSDLKRAADTAKEIAKYHPDTEIHFVKELREIDVGEFTDKGYDETDWKNPPKDLESFDKAQKRVKDLLDRVYPKKENKTILFVSHHYTIKALITVLFNETEKYKEKYHFDNTSISIIEVNDGKDHKIHLLNSTRHLE